MEISSQDRFDRAQGEIGRQLTRIAEIRTIAGIVIAATSLVTSFLGSEAIELHRGSTVVSDLALGLLPLGLFFTCRALWPLRDFSAKGSAAALLGKVSSRLLRLSLMDLVWRHGPSPGDLEGHDLGKAAEILTGYVRDNQRLLDRRANMLMAAIVVLMMQGVLWSVALVVG